MYWIVNELGSGSRLLAWVKEAPENERVFWAQMYTKLLPKDINTTVENVTPRGSEKDIDSRIRELIAESNKVGDIEVACMSSEHFGPRAGNLREYLAHLV